MRSCNHEECFNNFQKCGTFSSKFYLFLLHKIILRLQCKVTCMFRKRVKERTPPFTPDLFLYVNLVPEGENEALSQPIIVLVHPSVRDNKTSEVQDPEGQTYAYVNKNPMLISWSIWSWPTTTFRTGSTRSTRAGRITSYSTAFPRVKLNYTQLQLSNSVILLTGCPPVPIVFILRRKF